MLDNVKLDIREASTVDLEAIEALEKECFSDPWPRSAFESEVGGTAPSLVAMQDDVLVGFLCWMDGPQEMHVTNIAVRGSLRQKGVASRLLGRFLENAAQAGCESVYLDVRPSNSAARHLYEKFGFKEIFRRRKYYIDPPEDGLVMALPLSSGRSTGGPGTRPA